MANEPSLQQFVDRLVEEKGFADETPEVLAQIKEDLLSRVEDRINAVILENMPSHLMEEFEKKLDQESTEQVMAFCSENIPNINEVIAAELLNFRTTYLARG